MSDRTGPQRPRGRPKSFDREAVLRRAAELFWDKGYAGAHVAELVACTGVNRASLYAEFGGKAGLFRAALAQYVHRLAPLAAHLEVPARGLAALRAYFRGLLDFGFRHGCFAVNTIREKHVVPPAAFALVEELVAGGEAAFRATLAAARERGELAPAADVDALARAVTMFELGLLTGGILDPDRGAMERAVEQFLALLPGAGGGGAEAERDAAGPR